MALVQVFQHRHEIAGTGRNAARTPDHGRFLGQFDFLGDLIERLDQAFAPAPPSPHGFLKRSGDAVLSLAWLLPGETRPADSFPDTALAFVEIVVAGIRDNFAAIDFGVFVTIQFINSSLRRGINGAPLAAASRNCPGKMIDSEIEMIWSARPSAAHPAGQAARAPEPPAFSVTRKWRF